MSAKEETQSGCFKHNVLHQWYTRSACNKHMRCMYIPPLTWCLLRGMGVEMDVLFGFSGGDDSGVTAELASCGSLRAAGVMPKGERKSRKGPAPPAAMQSHIKTGMIKVKTCKR